MDNTTAKSTLSQLDEIMDFNHPSRTYSTSATQDDQFLLSMPLRVSLAVIVASIAIVSITGNSIMCFIVGRKAVMRSAINLLLANMALTQVLLSVFCMPFTIVTLLNGTWVLGAAFCQVEAFLNTFLQVESIFVLFIITISRYLLVVHRKEILHQGRAQPIIVITWTASAILSIPPAFGWGRYGYYPGWPQCYLLEATGPAETVYAVLCFSLQFFLPMSILSPAYFAIACTVRQRMRKVHTDTQQGVATVSPNRPSLRPNLSHNSISHAFTPDIAPKTQTFKTIFCIFLVFVVCWLPYALCVLAWNLSASMMENYVGGVVVQCLAYVTCALNPIIFYSRISKYRETCWDFLPKALQTIPPIPLWAIRRISPQSVYVVSPSAR